MKFNLFRFSIFIGIFSHFSLLYSESCQGVLNNGIHYFISTDKPDEPDNQYLMRINLPGESTFSLLIKKSEEHSMIKYFDIYAEGNSEKRPLSTALTEDGSCILFEYSTLGNISSFASLNDILESISNFIKNGNISDQLIQEFRENYEEDIGSNEFLNDTYHHISDIKSFMQFDEQSKNILRSILMEDLRNDESFIEDFELYPEEVMEEVENDLLPAFINAMKEMCFYNQNDNHIRECYRSFLDPRQMEISIYGDVNINQIKEQLEFLFGDNP